MTPVRGYTDMLRAGRDPAERGGSEVFMAKREKRIDHKIQCDCGATIEMTVVVQWEEGGMGETEKSIEGREFWQHMLHCIGE